MKRVTDANETCLEPTMPGEEDEEALQDDIPEGDPDNSVFLMPTKPHRLE